MTYLRLETKLDPGRPRFSPAGRFGGLLLIAMLFLPLLGVAQTPARGASEGLARISEAWTLAEIARRALEADPSVRASRALADIALTQYELELDRARPKLNLALTPFSWDSRRIFDFSTLSFENLSFDYENTRTLALGGGLSLNQALPSAGLLSAGAKSQFKVTDPINDIGFSLAPSLNASLRQPLGGWGGSLLPFNAAEATKRSAQISASQAGIDDQVRRNQAVRGAVESTGRVLVLRKNLAVQEAFLKAALGRAEALSLRRSAGTATEDAALELALTAELARQSLVDTRLALRDAERRLASVLGLESAGLAGEVRLPPLSEVLPRLASGTQSDASRGPDMARAALGVDKVLADATARSTLDAPVLNASLLVEPRYYDRRPAASNLASAFSDFFAYGDGSGVNWNFSLSLDIPLSAKAARDYRSRLDFLALEAAEAQKTQTERAVNDREAALTERRDALRERLAIQRRIAELELRKVERLNAQVSAGVAPPEDAADAKAELDRDLAEVLRLEFELLLTELDLRGLAGDDLGGLIISGY